MSQPSRATLAEDIKQQEGDRCDKKRQELVEAYQDYSAEKEELESLRQQLK